MLKVHETKSLPLVTLMKTWLIFRLCFVWLFMALTKECTDQFLTPSLLVSNIKKLQRLVCLPFSGLEQSGEFLLHLSAKFGKELNSPSSKGGVP